MKIIITVLLLFWGLFPARLLADFNYPMQAQKVAENVYAIITPARDLPNPQNGGWNSNSAFVVTENGVLLFDTGSSIGIGAAIKSTIARVTSKPVRWIVNSHAHGDHWLGNAEFGDSVQRIYATRTVTSLIANDGQRWVDNFNSMTSGVTGDSPIRVPDRVVDNETYLTLGGVDMLLFPSAGSHSPGDLMLWLPAQRVLIAGDVVYSDRMPSTNAGSLAQWIKTLDKLRAMQPVSVIPGHGAVTDISGITRLHDLLTSLWAAVKSGVDEGLSDYEILPRVVTDLARFSAFYPGLEDKLKRDISHVFLQVEAAGFE